MANPSGCRHCGIDKHEHVSQWAPMPVGWHTWAEPTIDQRKAAIKANAERARLTRRGPEPKPATAPATRAYCCDDEEYDAIESALRPVHYREAADALDAIADHREETNWPDAHTSGIRYAAERLRRAARDMEEDSTDA